MQRGLAFTAFFLLMSTAAPLLATERLSLQLGESLIEKGDYILAPGLQAAVQFPDGVRYRLDLSGRRFGSFLEATAMLSRETELPIFPWPDLKARIGLTLLDDYTAYHPPQGRQQEVHDVNLGVTVGLGYRIYRYQDWTLHAEWNSQIFAAGLAFLLLTTARKSVLTIAAEVSL